MCTVSYIPTANGNLITSNRDEHNGRGMALPPISETIGNIKIIYPKDPKSGGTWIAAKDNGEVAVLLNGAFENHEKQPGYRESRGTVMLKIIRSRTPLHHFEQMDLSGIENFTIILYKKNSLTQCRWDGTQKHIAQKDPKKPHIWSSVTLYSEIVRKQREQWFSAWINKTKDINQHQAIDFHHVAGDGNMINNMVMLRENGISTVSVTSIFVGHTDINMIYEDLKNGKENISFAIPLVNKPSILDRWKIKLRIIRIKTLNWEYWPMHMVYAPMYLYWLYLSAKARSFFFFSAANPMRQNAGFAMERKSETYQYLPEHFYPKTLVCAQGISVPELKMRLDDKGLNFPIITKPEIGERGTGVKLIKDLAGLVAYSRASNSDFLVQQFITHPFEVGIFYCRLPTEKHGKITGIVGKRFLSVIGDGEATIRNLLLKNDRHLLQLKTLEQEPDNSLEEVLQKDEERLLVPYGNHCRGAKFEDLSYLITDRLSEVIDKVCQQLPAFYFGRLDIKFQNWEELENGNFSVIELNGAASEPTHMYDPRHSIFFAWKEIKRHWDMLYQISIVNSKINSIPLMSTAEGMQMLRAHSVHISKFAKEQ